MVMVWLDLGPGEGWGACPPPPRATQPTTPNWPPWTPPPTDPPNRPTGGRGEWGERPVVGLRLSWFVTRDTPLARAAAAAHTRAPMQGVNTSSPPKPGLPPRPPRCSLLQALEKLFLDHDVSLALSTTSRT